MVDVSVVDLARAYVRKAGVALFERVSTRPSGFGWIPMYEMLFVCRLRPRAPNGMFTTFYGARLIGAADGRFKIHLSKLMSRTISIFGSK